MRASRLVNCAKLSFRSAQCFIVFRSLLFTDPPPDFCNANATQRNASHQVTSVCSVRLGSGGASVLEYFASLHITSQFSNSDTLLFSVAHARRLIRER